MNKPTEAPAVAIAHGPAQHFAARAAGITGSVIDSSIALLQRRGQPTISFAMGCPAAEAIPSAAIAELAAEILADARGEALNCGPNDGEASLRRKLLHFPIEIGEPVAAGRLMITAGGTQGLDLVAKLFVDPGDLVIAEEPSYTNGIAHCHRL